MSALRKRLDNKRYKRYSNPPANNYKKRVQLEAHKAYQESVATLSGVKGFECEIGKEWGLYMTVVFVCKKKHPGPVSAP
jgi:hypothetical protein